VGGTDFEGQTVGGTDFGERERWAVIFLVGWVGVYVAVFSLARTKLPSYVTPVYPALALLVGWLMDRWRRGALAVAPLWIYGSLGTLVAIGLAMGPAAVIAARMFLPSMEHLAWIASVPLFGGLVAMVLVAQGRIGAAQYTLAGTAAALMLALFAWAAPQVSRHQQSLRLVQDPRERTGHGPVADRHSALVPTVTGPISSIRHLWIQQDQTPAAIFPATPAKAPNATANPPRSGSRHPQAATLVAYRDLEPSWVFYAGRPIPLYSTQRRHELADQLRRNPTLQVITTRRHWEQFQRTHHLPHRVLMEVPYFLNPGESLVRVGHRDWSQPRFAQSDLGVEKPSRRVRIAR
jgi:4-amino-4-deoxy-L-arabinose transferase-like glycosyltransferase